jgi:hypothetical protein
VGLKEGEYKIVHASGERRLSFCEEWRGEECVKSRYGEFNRKVVINVIMVDLLGSLSNPLGFGRIKLWD